MLITRLWRDQPGDYFCISTKKDRKVWHDEFFARDELGEVEDYVQEHRDCDVYFCPHGFSRARRLKEYAVLPNMLWSDLDEADPRTLSVRPTIAIESSPGRYVGLWLLDQKMTESVNRRLSYMLGADKGGWDLTQVLRVPGTTNHKYASKPKTRILWGDKAGWKLSDIKKLLPAEKSAEPTETSGAAELYAKYERKMAPYLRRLLNARQATGDRSEVLWKMGASCLECGMTREEAFVLIKASVWNKFAERRNGDEQLKRELEKNSNAHHRGEGVVGESEEVNYPKRADSIEPKTTDWLYYPYVPKNGITIIGAKGGTGKGLYCSDIVGRMTRGDHWPLSKERSGGGGVLWGEAEDKLSETVVPRLIAAKADMSRVWFTKPSEFAECDIREFIREQKIKLIVLSPLMSFLEGLEDANVGIETRRALEYLDSVIEGTGCAMIGVMHVNKKSDLGAMDRILGSVEFANYARSAILMNKDEESIVRVMHGKHNLGIKGEDLIFAARNRRERTHPRGQYVGIDWERPEDNVDSDKAFDRKAQSDNEDQQSAGKWLLELLKDGELECGEIFSAGEKASYSAAALKKAKLRSRGKVRERNLGRGRVVWYLA